MYTPDIVEDHDHALLLGDPARHAACIMWDMPKAGAQ
jgi:hypothetical protein